MWLTTISFKFLLFQSPLVMAFFISLGLHLQQEEGKHRSPWIVFQGIFYLGGCKSCCKRWFITFKGAECSGPLPIDAVNFIKHSNQNNHKHGAIEGFRDNIRKGTIRAGINTGN